MPGKLDQYRLGLSGVNVDKSPVHLDDSELTKAQNCVIDSLGVEGGIRKRPGLTKVNSIAAAGAVSGIVSVPLAKPSTRKLIVARRVTSADMGWNVSTDAGATWATSGGPDGFSGIAEPRAPEHVWTGMVESGDTTNRYRSLRSGRPGVVYNNRLYYAGNDYVVGTDNPTIRMFDGTTDFLVGQIPNRGTSVANAIIDIVAGKNGFLYLTTYDTGIISSNTLTARIFEFDPENLVLSQLGSAFPKSPETARVPFTCCWHANRLWARTHAAGISSVTHLLYFIRPEIDDDWTSLTPEASARGCNVMVSYKGQLYMGLPADATVAATVVVRSPLDAYSTSLTVALGDASPNMVSFGALNGFASMIVFEGNLYGAYFNMRGALGATGDRYARIYKFDGTTWTVVYNPAVNHATAVAFNHAVVHDGVVYFVSAPQYPSTTDIQVILKSSDGSSWSDVSTGLTNFSGGFMGVLTS